MSKRIACLLVLTLAALTSSASATIREARIPLKDGKLRTADLSAALCRELGMPRLALNVGEINLSGLGGALWVTALNESLGDGCRLSVSGDAVVLRIDTDKLPDGVRDAKRAARAFTAAVAPEATARQQATYGLWTPRHVDNRKPLVVLVHGLDGDRTNWQPMAGLLHGIGRQVAVFTYPSDQPIADSARALGDELAGLRLRIPRLSFDLICHSMGGLVAREYVEGEGYRGGVERLILLGTPNRGTRWASQRWALEAEEHYSLWRDEDEWSPSWMITDGLGEAGADLKPHSDFLETLNARPRRDGVRYTIIAGNQHPARRMTADCLDRTADWVPGHVSHWWGFRHAKDALEAKAGRMRQGGGSDGPVGVTRCKLKGVDDFVIVPADHVSLFYPVNGQPPKSWDTIRDRLSR